MQLCASVASACTVSTFTAPSSQGTVTHKIGTSASTFTIPAWVQKDSGNVDCSYTETLTFSPALADHAYVSVSGRVITIDSSSSSDLNTSQLFTVTSTLNDNAVSNDNGYTFTVAFSNPCASYTAPASPADRNYNIGTGAVTFDIGAWTKGDNDCSYSDTLAISPSHASTTLSTRTVTINSADTGLVDTSQTFTVTSTLTNDPFSGSNNGYTFKVTFKNPCATFTAPSSPSTRTYNIGTGSDTFTIAAWTKGDAACTYSEALSFTPSHASISLSGRVVTISSVDTSLAT